MILQDGQSYENFEDLLDIGSWVAYKVSDGNVREYVENAFSTKVKHN